jgi:hypothetical protein
MTLLDFVYDAYDKYIKRSSKEAELKAGKGWGTGDTKGGDDPQLTPDKRRELAYQSPIFMKGVRKKTMDSVRAWFDIETDNNSAPISIDEKALKAFEKRSNYKKKFASAVRDAHIYGDGFLLIQFDVSDEGIKLEAQPPENAEPVNVMVLNPEKITKVKYVSEENKSKDLYHYVYSGSMGDQLIHPDRIQHIVINEDSTSKLGVAHIDILRNTIKSKKNVDIAVGRILSWFSHGLLDIKAKDIDDDEIEEITKVAKTHPSSWVHDEEDFELEVIQPSAIDPEHFMNFLVLNIASVLVMPVHVLTGIQVGKVTGAEIGFADYYRDIKDMQELIYTPLIESLYKRIIEARGRTWKYNLKWLTVYVDELGEANIMEKRMAFVTQGIQAGIIDKEEGRKMLNEGMIELDLSKQIKDPPLPKRPEPDFNPPKRPTSKKEKEDKEE